MSRNLDPRSLFPPQADFQPIKAIHYTDFDLRNGIPYSVAVATVSVLSSSAESNLTVVVRNASIGTWALAFADFPKVSRVIAIVDPRDRKKIENVTKALGKRSQVSIVSERDAQRQISSAHPNWLIFFNRGFPNQLKVGQANQIAGLYPKGPPKQLPQGWDFSSSRVGLNGPTVVIGSPSKLNRVQISNSKENLWLRGLQKYLYNLLSNGISNPQHLEQMVAQGSLTNVWIPAFTTRSVNPQVNNERLEYLGDEISGMAFSEYLRRNFPQLTEADMSNLKAYYMSEQFQPEMARILGLENWIRFLVPAGTSKRAQDYMKTKILEDVFESFFGGIRVISTDLYGLGTSVDYAMQMMNYVMSKVDIDFDRTKGSARTVFEQLFTRLKWQKPTFVVQKVGDEVMVQIRLSPSTRSRILERGLPDPGEILVEVTGKGEKQMRTLAAEEGLKKMKEFGLMQATSEQIRVQQEFETPQMMQLKPKLDEQFEALGYEKPNFESINTTEGVVTNLLGDLDGVPMVLATGAGQNFREAKLAAIQAFLDQ